MNKAFHRVIESLLALLVVASSLACIILPIVGASRFFDAFRQPYSAKVHAELLTAQLLGPSYTFLLSASLLTLLMLRKRLRPWLWLAVLLGPIHTVRSLGGLGHDFSHAVFQECSGIYGTWIRALCLVGGASLVILAAINRFTKQRNLP